MAEPRHLVRDGDMGEERAARSRVAKRGDFCAPLSDDAVPTPKPGGVGCRDTKHLFDIVFSAVVCAILALPVAVCACSRCLILLALRFPPRADRPEW